MLESVRAAGGDTAVVFIHGFGGREGATFGDFPELLTRERALDGWDVWDLGYATGLAPDLRGVWAGNPGIDTLATYLRTRLTSGELAGYASIALIAHSMGGLVVQKALVDAAVDGDLQLLNRVGHVFLFGTPSGGLRKAGPFAFWSRAVGGMARDGEFITGLRRGWSSAFGDVPDRFRLWVAAGDRDEFVPATSSLEPFDRTVQHVVHGNHVEIVKPGSRDNLSVQLVVRGLQDDAAASGPWNAARVAVETQRFQDAVDRFSGHVDELDDAHLVQLALALESLGRTEEALAHLSDRESLGSDAKGVLAGRLKRRWIAEGRAADRDDARRLYAEAHLAAEEAGRWGQALYHGINEAFMLAVDPSDTGDRPRARQLAEKVLDHCAKVDRRDHWREATIGEAKLHLGEREEALAAYRRAVHETAPPPGPREIASMYQQALVLVEALGMDLVDELEVVFREEPTSPA